MSTSKDVNASLKRIQKYQRLLLNFKNFSKSEKKWVKEEMSDELAKLIIEICHNINEKHLDLDKMSAKKLDYYKSKMLQLTDKQKPLDQRKRLIQQGGFLSKLLSTVGGDVIGNLVSRF